MSDPLGVVVYGLSVGLGYGLLGAGFVLVYRASRFVNFAQGQIGVVAAAILARLVVDSGLNYWVSLACALGAGAALGAVIERTLVARLFSSSRLVLMIATIALAQLLLVPVVIDGSPIAADPLALAETGYPVPFDVTVTVGERVVNSAELAMIVVAPAVALALALFFGRSRVGRQIRAASSNPEAARLAGISVRRVSLVVWMLAGSLSALTAVLQAPGTPTLDLSSFGPSLVLRGLAAALIAGMVDFRVAFVAGAALGIAEQVAFDVLQAKVPGSADITVLVVVLAATAIRGRTLATRTKHREPPLGGALGGQRAAGRTWSTTAWIAVAGGVAAAPLLPGLDTQDKAIGLTLLAVAAVVGLSLTVLTGWTGQVSLGHFAFLGVGAFAAAKAASWGWGFPAVVIVAAVCSALVAVVVGLPALRFPGLFLAVTTLGFSLVAQHWLFLQPWFGQRDAGSASVLGATIPLVGDVTTPRAIYYVAVALLGLSLSCVATLRRTAVGRAMVAVRDNEAQAAANGLSAPALKVVALAFSGALAGAGGAVWALAQRNFSFQAFDATMSLTMLGVAVVGGLGTLHGPLLGSLAVFGWPYLVSGANTVEIRSLTSGALLLVVLLFLPGGLGSLIPPGSRGRRSVRPDDSAKVVTPFARADATRGAERTAPSPSRWLAVDLAAPPLDVRSLSLSFGGIAALDGVDVRVDEGEIVGLVGGNGAGKSTLMATVSGHLRPDHGSVLIFGCDTATLAPEYRAHLGVARTFQDARLYAGLTVEQALLVAIDWQNRTGALGAMVGAPWVRFAERQKRNDIREALDYVGLSDASERLTCDLSTGMRRLVDLAAVIAARPRLVLLDEPTAGLAQREVEAFEPLLRGLRRDFECSVLIVEHDVPLIVRLCDRVYCMEAGEVIAAGAPGEIVDDPRVAASFLGTDAATIERSGPHVVSVR